MRKLARLIKLLAWGCLGAAIVQELRTPAADRKWHGTVGGVVPYDFRVPSPEKLRDAWWNPDGPLITETAFGVGWAINFARVVEMVDAKT
jgi:hypothetical protein